MDARFQLLRVGEVATTADLVIGHSRFSGGMAEALRDVYLPQARRLHLIHTSSEELDRHKGDPAQADDHAATERALLGRSDLAVAVGPLLYDEALRLTSGLATPPPVHELIPGFTPRAHRPRPTVQHNRLRILLLGRTDDVIKGARPLARALGELRSKGLEPQFTVRGAKVKDVPKYEKILSKLANHQVRVKPFTTDQAELEADFAATHLVVMPSLHEGFGMVAWEAAERGIPFLVTGNSGAAMFLRDDRRVPNGLGQRFVVDDGYTPAGRITAWADSIAEVAQHLPEAEQRTAALADHLAANHTWDHAATALMERVAQLPTRGREPAPMAEVAWRLHEQFGDTPVATTVPGFEIEWQLPDKGGLALRSMIPAPTDAARTGYRDLFRPAAQARSARVARVTR